MAFYNRIKSGKLAPIGTIMPWGGGSQSGQGLDNIPAGWIVCSLNNATLNAADYPLLAATLGNQYGPFPEEGSGFVNGVNNGIVNDFPYNKDESLGHLDIFGLPNLNQLALVDIEGQRQQPNSSSLTAADKIAMGIYIGVNGPDATQPPTLLSSDVDITFTLEPSNQLAGRITGITMDDPIYFDTAYVVPRKLGVNHIPEHGHKPATDSEFDQFWGAYAFGNGVQEFVPPTADKDKSYDYGAVAPAGQTQGAQAGRWKPGEKNISWFDEFDGGLSLPDGTGEVYISPELEVIPAIPATSRPIAQRFYHVDENFPYNDNNLALPNVQTTAHVGAFPPAGYYNGRRNYYQSVDIPAEQRGLTMPLNDILDEPYDPSLGELQPINTAVTNTYTTTLNHDGEGWGSDTLRSHAHDAMEVSMARGSLSIPSTILINDIATGTTAPLSVATALSVQINPNTPSLTVMYIIRAY
jgi:hypothetical protein|tara:strand:- start:11898 stop:13298 length:1401 start_codon:yes stop_codon:yes gene_type:complete